MVGYRELDLLTVREARTDHKELKKCSFLIFTPPYSIDDEATVCMKMNPIDPARSLLAQKCNCVRNL